MPVTTSTIAQLATQVGQRLQDDSFIFWLQQQEAYVALAEAMNDLILLVGRPTITYNLQIALQPNTVWQPMPANMLAITNIRSDQYSLWKTSLHSMDYLQTSWGPDWTSDIADTPLRYGPLGFTKFFVHPAPSTPITVNVSGVSMPITEEWPPTGAEESPFEDSFDVALQMYATAYMRLKLLGNDAEIGNELYQQYLDLASRMTQIQDRKDPLIFSRSLGSATSLSVVSLR